MLPEGVRLYCGGDAQNVQRRRCNLTGYRCFSGSYGPMSRFTPEEARDVVGILDSGAFSDSPEERLSPDAALERQMRWECNAERWWGIPWQAEALVSYDLLIDEKWAGGVRKKERWSISDADHAVRTTVEAAAFLAGQRNAVAPRKCLLACQGVDAIQYAECVQGVLSHATSADWIGLGGWCILGRFKSWIPTFWATVRRVLPLIATAGIRRVHIFGVMYLPVLGPLLWLCDHHEMSLSTDSSGPILSPAWKDQKKAGSIEPTWEGNVVAWRKRLTNLRQSVHYCEPPSPHARRQMSLFQEVDS